MSKVEADLIDEQNTEAAREWGLFNRFIIGDKNDVYLDRLTLITTPWFSIKLHRIHRPDQQRDLHDHPWTFLSLVLWGWYEELVPHIWCRLEGHAEGRHVGAVEVRRVRWFNWKRAGDRHAICSVSRKPVWTLVLCGPRVRVWGFWVDRGTRWVPWREYEKLNDA